MSSATRFDASAVNTIIVPLQKAWRRKVRNESCYSCNVVVRGSQRICDACYDNWKREYMSKESTEVVWQNYLHKCMRENVSIL